VRCMMKARYVWLCALVALMLAIPALADFVNGDFETGDLTGWSSGGTGTATVGTDYAHSGTYGCQLASFQGNNEAWISQSIDMTDADTLTFWYYGVSFGAGNFAVYIDGSSVWSTSSTTSGWVQVSLDVSSYTGSHDVNFQVGNSPDVAGANAKVYLDDVSCPAPSPPADTYNLTVHALDASDNNTTIYRFYASLNESYTAGTSTGAINFTGLNGTYSLAVWGDFYQPTVQTITVDDTTGDVEINVSLTSLFSQRQLISFLVMRGLTPQPDIPISIFRGGFLQQQGTTGEDGRVAFYLLPTYQYLFHVNDTEKVFNLTPSETSYIIALPLTNASYSSTPANFTYNMSTNNTTLVGAVNEGTLTSMGLGSLGRGIVASAVLWTAMAGSSFLQMGLGVPLVGLIILVVLTLLGFTSWFVVLLAFLTVLAVYVLRGGIG